MSYNNLGYLVSQSGAGTLRERAEKAIEFHEKARELQERLARGSPANLSLQRDLGNTYRDLARIHRMRRDPDAAMPFISQAIELRQRWAQADPENVDAQASLGTALNEQGRILELAQRRDDAAQAFEKAIKIYQAVVEKAPPVTRYRDELRGIQANLARVQAKSVEQP